MTGWRIALVTISTLSIPALGWGQDRRWTPEVSASVGLEVRWLEASWLSRENLAITRLGIRTTYSW